jgi:hypothetical protein
VIGRNKTGTTSLEQLLKSSGYKMGHQAAAELLLHDWARRDFSRVVDLCKAADAFQDIPFSLPYTYQAVDAAFPGSLFILSIRESSSAWYESLVRYHQKLLGVEGRIPTAEELRTFGYQYPGWLLDAQKWIYGVDETSLYDRERYILHYEAHNRNVIEYFRHRQDSLLVLRLDDTDAVQKLVAFLRLPPDLVLELPHLNSSDDAEALDA